MENNYITNSFKNKLQNQTIEFLTFLVNERILTLGIGLVVGTQIYSLINIFTTNILSPILNKIFKTRQEKLSDFKISILGIKFEIGKIVASLLNFLIVVYILFLLFKLEKKIEATYIKTN
jgi:large conductance mechanosensitive channel